MAVFRKWRSPTKWLRSSIHRSRWRTSGTWCSPEASSVWAAWCGLPPGKEITHQNSSSSYEAAYNRSISTHGTPTHARCDVIASCFGQTHLSDEWMWGGGWSCRLALGLFSQNIWYVNSVCILYECLPSMLLQVKSNPLNQNEWQALKGLFYAKSCTTCLWSISAELQDA